MDSKSIWFEVTIAGLVHFLALVFFVLACFQIGSLPTVANVEHYLPYVSALVIGFSYVIGLSAHYVVPIVGEKLLPDSWRKWLRHQHETPPSADVASLTVKALLYGNEVLFQLRRRIYNTLVLFRLLTSGFFCLGISASLWMYRTETGVLWWFPAPTGFLLGILFAWLYSLQYPKYASIENATVQEIGRRSGSLTSLKRRKSHPP
ncbi:MAG: hypothetical protein HY708_02710 [Ignavibacteriae bacterium]|nr:hypothetical protein [Ignavibacteriota bacterium]